MKKSLPFSILSGLLLILAFPPFDHEILAWIAFVPLLLATRDSRHPFLLGYLFGFIFFSGTLFWLTNVTKIGFLLLILYLSLYPGIFAFLVAKCNFPARNFFAAGLWVLLEYIVSHLFTGFPWLLLGYSQYKNLRVIQISSIFGVYIISGLVVLINISLSQLLSRQKTRLKRKTPRVSIALSFLLLLLAFLFGVYQEVGVGVAVRTSESESSRIFLLKEADSPVTEFIRPSGLDKSSPYNFNDQLSIKVSIIQGNIPSLQRWEPISKEENVKIYLDLTKKAAKSKPELVVWPESAISTYLRLDEPIQKTLLNYHPHLFPPPSMGRTLEFSSPPPLRGRMEKGGELVKKKSFYLLAGSLDRRERKDYNSAFLISPQGEIEQSYDKVHLVPYGEYILGGKFPPLRRFVIKAAGFIPDFSPGKNYTIFSLPKGNFATLICFEDIFPELSRRFTKKGANFLVNITNDSWFGDSGASQHFAAAVLRAVENRRHLLRAANTGISGIVAPSGRILKKVEENGRALFVSGFLIEEIEPTSSLSFYTRFGDIPLALICLGLMTIPLITRKWSF